jgi:hypothetical protein
MAEFVQALDSMNALAEASPGFVWRFKTDAGNATSVRAYDDPLILFNMSVWESIEDLKGYAYRSLHGKFFARRQSWFQPMEDPHLALWWIPAGTLPEIADAKERLELLTRHGESPRAFTFRTTFGPDGHSA